MEEDEFIDDIPFPETQNYVKRILGTAEDYRRLYGEGEGRPLPKPTVKAASKPSKASTSKHSSTTKKKTPAKKASAKKTPAKKKTGK